MMNLSLRSRFSRPALGILLAGIFLCFYPASAAHDLLADVKLEALKKKIQRHLAIRCTDALGGLRSEFDEPSIAIEGTVALEMLALMPFDAISDDLKTKLVTPYFHEDEPVLESDKISYPKDRKELEPGGPCQICTETHISTLLSPYVPDLSRIVTSAQLFRTDPGGKVALLYIDGHLVASVKMVRQTTLLALRTVRNSDGKTLLVRGGTYYITKKLKYRLMSEAVGRKWTNVHLESLEVEPQAWLVTSHAWAFSKIIPQLTSLAGVPNRRSISEHAAAMGYLSRKLKEVRQKLEGRTGPQR
ncbi:MAG: hypothetical protein AB7G93_03690 [Bdellovibrionales bacterium]